MTTLIDLLAGQPWARRTCLTGKGAGPAGLLPRSAFEAIRRGLVGRCPACGCARLFRSFLQPVPICPACGGRWRERTADDFPPYLVILAVGHIVAPGMIAMEMLWHPPLWVHLSVWLPLVVLLGFGLIQPMKGAVIAIQWWHWDRVRTDDEEPAEGAKTSGARWPRS